MSEDCIFCRIARGEIPSATVYEDETVIAFDDLSPQAPVHTLVIPKMHHADLADNVSDAELAAIFAVVPKIAEAKGIAQSGYRVIVNNGEDARQTVKHLHVHVMGGAPMTHGMIDFADD